MQGAYPLPLHPPQAEQAHLHHTQQACAASGQAGATTPGSAGALASSATGTFAPGNDDKSSQERAWTHRHRGPRVRAGPGSGASGRSGGCAPHGISGSALELPPASLPLQPWGTCSSTHTCRQFQPLGHLRLCDICFSASTVMKHLQQHARACIHDRGGTCLPSSISAPAVASAAARAQARTYRHLRRLKLLFNPNHLPQKAPPFWMRHQADVHWPCLPPNVHVDRASGGCSAQAEAREHCSAFNASMCLWWPQRPGKGIAKGPRDAARRQRHCKDTGFGRGRGTPSTLGSCTRACAFL